MLTGRTEWSEVHRGGLARRGRKLEFMESVTNCRAMREQLRVVLIIRLNSYTEITNTHGCHIFKSGMKLEATPNAPIQLAYFRHFGIQFSILWSIFWAVKTTCI